MTNSQSLYALAFSVYLVFFLLFARFLVWKIYSEKKYWNKRFAIKPGGLSEIAENMGKSVPFISIVVPARNESLVIENTILHLQSLEYLENRFEIVVVTDEKETLSAQNDRNVVLEATLSLLSGAKRKFSLTAEQENMLKGALLSCLSEYALNEYLSKKCQKSYSTRAAELLCLDGKERHAVTRDIALSIVDVGGAPPQSRLKRILKRHCPHLSGLDLERVYPACLSVAVPVIAAYASLSGGDGHSLLKKTVGHTAQANRGLTQDIIMRMTEFIASRVVKDVKAASSSQDMRHKIRRDIVQMYPTTQEITEKVMRGSRGRKSCPVKHFCVPWDFDGLLNGSRKGVWTPSTKGRALNWAIPLLDPRTEICGFYDAESRPAKDVLLYIGYKRLLAPDSSRVLQGPVFQIRNFYEMMPFCKIASLYQAVAHDWYLPWLFRTLPFVGGTNVYIEYDLLNTVGGWDCKVLTEDLEFGARAYLLCDAWPEYLPYPSSEQTPPTFGAFFRQRLRWGTGHLQVVDKISSEAMGDDTKRRVLRDRLIIKGQVEWVLYQAATLVPPVVMGLHLKNMVDPAIVPPAGRCVLSFFSLLYTGFTFYAFRRYKKHVDTSVAPEGFFANALIYLELLFLPLAAFIFPVPYTSALLLKMVGKEPKVWVKTPRTKEARSVS